MFCDQALSQVSDQIQHPINDDNDGDDNDILSIKEDSDNATSYGCTPNIMITIIDYDNHDDDVCNDRDDCVLGPSSICTAGGNSNIGSPAIGDILSDIDSSINTNVFIAHQRAQPGDHQYLLGNIYFSFYFGGPQKCPRNYLKDVLTTLRKQVVLIR